MVQWSDMEIKEKCGIHHVSSMWREVGVCTVTHKIVPMFYTFGLFIE